MTDTQIQYYDLNQYSTIMFESYHYKLPSSIYDTINDLRNKLGITIPIKKEEKNYKTKISYVKTEENWEHIKPFKATVIIENKDGVEKTMNEIRICLNKISTKNYETNKNTIMELMDVFVENSPELEKIANIIFDIASTNKFFSEIYAELYKCLLEKYNIFSIVLNSFLDKFALSMHNIQYVDQRNDYDAFCKYNKMNDYRKASSVFIVNLVKKNVLEKELLFKLINEIQQDLLQFIDDENKINEVDEITENLFLFITESHSIMKTTEEWKNIISNVEVLSKYKVKERLGLSSRAIFKYMDIMDKVKV